MFLNKKLNFREVKILREGHFCLPAINYNFKFITISYNCFISPDDLSLNNVHFVANSIHKKLESLTNLESIIGVGSPTDMCCFD